MRSFPHLHRPRNGPLKTEIGRAVSGDAREVAPTMQARGYKIGLYNFFRAYEFMPLFLRFFSGDFSVT